MTSIEGDECCRELRRILSVARPRSPFTQSALASAAKGELQNANDQWLRDYELQSYVLR